VASNANTQYLWATDGREILKFFKLKSSKPHSATPMIPGPGNSQAFL